MEKERWFWDRMVVGKARRDLKQINHRSKHKSKSNFFKSEKRLFWTLKKSKILNLSLFFLIILNTILFLAAVNQIFIYLDSNITGAAIVEGQVEVCIDMDTSLETIEDQTVAHNSEFAFQINASRADDGNNLSFESNVSLFDLVNVSWNNSLINFTPTISEVGEYNVLISAYTKDSSCPDVAKEEFMLLITNTAPTFSSSISDKTWLEDTVLVGIDLSNYFEDAEGDILYWGIEGNENIVAEFKANGVVKLIPNRDWFGNETVNFTANDSINISRSNEVLLEVVDVTDYCGDGVCGAIENCRNCRVDCGICPRGGFSGRSGKVARGISLEKRMPIRKIPDFIKERMVDFKDKIVDFRDRAKEMRDVIFKKEIPKRIEIPSRTEVGLPDERVVVEKCEPSWICSSWEPKDCILGEVQTRTCYDQKNCGFIDDVALERDCHEDKKALVDLAAELAPEGIVKKAMESGSFVFEKVADVFKRWFDFFKP